MTRYGKCPEVLDLARGGDELESDKNRDDKENKAEPEREQRTYSGPIDDPPAEPPVADLEKDPAKIDNSESA
jgi:hypothetical protein